MRFDQLLISMAILSPFQSLYGTRVNRINYKDSRCILSEGDILGFGCNPTATRTRDKTDKRYYVYRLAIGNGINSSETIELSDGSDDETENENPFTDALDIDNETDDEANGVSSDEEDIKPDIHSLMRYAQETMQIKQEIEGYCYDYEKEKSPNNEPIIDNIVPICLDDDDEKDDIVLLEPPRKRVRQGDLDPFPSTPEPEPEPTVEDSDDSGSEPTLPEYQMSDTTLKEKVKLVVRSRGQQLADDMLKPQKVLLKNMNEGLTHAKGNRTPLHSEASTSSSVNQIYKTEQEYSDYSIADLNNAFISEVTKWDHQWIRDKKPNPLPYCLKIDLKHLDTNFIDLAPFQRFG